MFACDTKRFAITFLFLLHLLVSAFGQRDQSYFSPIAPSSVCDQNGSYYYDMSCAFKPCALELNSSG